MAAVAAIAPIAGRQGVMNGPQAVWLRDGRRLHLNHGPIDLIVEAFGSAAETGAAYAQAVARFETILTELVEELPELRRPSAGLPRAFESPAAQRMERAVCPHAKNFITPMAAVAGSVADEIMAAMVAGRTLQKAYVNNGGDSALYLGDGQAMTMAIAGAGQGFGDRLTIRAEDAVRGIATSGWRGRSHSLGIADAVTVLAGDAAAADAAATIIANAVDLPGHPGIERVPASSLQPDSDLGERLVTVGVGMLLRAEAAEALERGLAVAEDLRRRGLIQAAALFLGGETRICATMAFGTWGDAQALNSALHATPLWPAGHLPLKGGDQLSSSPSPISNAARQESAQTPPISLLAGEMSGRTEGGAKECSQSRMSAHNALLCSEETYHA